MDDFAFDPAAPAGPPAAGTTMGRPPDAGASGAPSALDAPDLDAADLAARLRRLSDEVGRLYHDVNNPLAVISGNAQLLLEIGSAEGLSPDVMEPVADIEVAAQQLVAVLQRLARLREDVSPFRS